MYIRKPRAALVSVFDKTNLEALSRYLEENNYEIYSTGGTKTAIENIVKNKEIVKSISDYTGSPEICNGRVKTLHPKIFGGILGLRENNNHHFDLNSIGGVFFDVVVVNLYPFKQTLKTTRDEALLLENIDIGGHTLMRAAAKNHKHVSILTNPNQYSRFIKGKTNNLELAKKAFAEAMKYDIAINNWINDDSGGGQTVGNYYEKERNMKYGLNPYMKPAVVYSKNDNTVPFAVLNGNPGYINFLDVNYAIRLVLEAKQQLGMECCASFKHNSPAGVAVMPHNIKENILLRTRNIDPKSSFGDIIGFSGTVNKSMAELLKTYVSDGIVALDYTGEALEILKQKKKGNYLIMQQGHLVNGMEFRDVNGTTLMQPSNDSVYECIDDTIPIHIKDDMTLGYITLKYTQSNCVCYVYNGHVIGIGSGQQNRVDCVKIAGEKAKDWMKRNNLDIKTADGIILVSDAFFPFADNIDIAADYGVQYILQPGGSIRDNEIFDACNKYNIKMVCSNQRVFTH